LKSKHNIIQQIEASLKTPINKVFFAHANLVPPLLAFSVNFPRLEVPIDGCYETEIEKDGKIEVVTLSPGEALFIPQNCWNKPTWMQPVRLISFLFGKENMGVSIVSADGESEESINTMKTAVHRPFSGPGMHIIKAILELHSCDHNFPAFPQLVQSLIVCCYMLIESDSTSPLKKSRSLFEEITTFLQGHFQSYITRSSVAKLFNISPNHVSRLFRKEGSMTFNDYITFVRIDYAKFLLLKHDLKVAAVALRCGYHDIGYFCRLFKRITKATPTEYRLMARKRNINRIL